MLYKLITTQTNWTSLIRHVLKDKNERFAFAYCFSSTMASHCEEHFLLHCIDLPKDEEYQEQSNTKVSLKADKAITRIFQARHYTAFIDIHSHPFCEQPSPSEIDRRGYQQQQETFHNLAPNTKLITIIVGQSGQIWAEVSHKGGWIAVSEIVVLGQQRQVILPVNAPAPVSPSIKLHEQRTQAVLGQHYSRLHNLKILVIGAGGVGSAVVAQLRGYIDRLFLIDPDIVEIHNAPRLYGYKLEDIGRPKVSVLANMVRESFPEVEVKTWQAAFPTAETMAVFQEADFVFCCPDHNAVRYAVAQAASRYLKPIIEVGCGGKSDHGKITALGYHVRAQFPGEPCLVCNGMDLSALEDPNTTEMKQRIGYVENDQLIQGELIPLTTRAAADAVDLFFRYITGYAPTIHHLYFDALQWRSLDLTRVYHSQHGCSLCGNGEDTLLGVGDHLSTNQRILLS